MWGRWYLFHNGRRNRGTYVERDARPAEGMREQR